jgi:hypothetical protein
MEEMHELDRILIAKEAKPVIADSNPVGMAMAR